MRLRNATLAATLCIVAAGAAFAALAWRSALPPITGAAAFDQATVVRGAQLAAIGDCAVCHAGRGGQAYAGGNPVQTPFGAIYASNITPDRSTGIGTWSEAAFRRAMRTGVDRAGNFLYPAFPYNHYTHVSDGDIAAIYAFLMTRAPIAAQTPATRLPFPLDIRPVLAGWNLLFLNRAPITPDPAKDAAWNRGATLVEGLGHCQACHTPHNLFGAEQTGHAFQGGLADGWDGPGLTAATSPAAIAWTYDALYDYLRNGLNRQHAAAAGPMGPVSHDLSAVPEADVRAMASYIASLTGAPDPARERQVAQFVAAAQAAAPDLAAMPGAPIFAGACAGCHGAGAPMMLGGRPSLALGSSVTAPSPRDAVQIVLGGLHPPPGESGPWMPGYSGSLTDTQVVAVLAYMRARFSEQPAWHDLKTMVRQVHGSQS